MCSVEPYHTKQWADVIFPPFNIRFLISVFILITDRFCNFRCRHFIYCAVEFARLCFLVQLLDIHWVCLVRPVLYAMHIFRVFCWEDLLTHFTTVEERKSWMSRWAPSGLLKLKFHWDQFPRNFPVADVTGKSPTSYEEVGRVASLLRGSYEEAGDFLTISTCQDGLATSPTSS